MGSGSSCTGAGRGGRDSEEEEMVNARRARSKVSHGAVRNPGSSVITGLIMKSHLKNTCGTSFRCYGYLSLVMCGNRFNTQDVKTPIPGSVLFIS